MQALKTKCKVILYSNSSLVVGAIGKDWAIKWRKKGWRKGKKWRSNADLWDKLLDLSAKHEMEVIWIKGHSNILENERADRLSILAANSKDLAIDEAYENGRTQLRPPTLF